MYKKAAPKTGFSSAKVAKKELLKQAAAVLSDAV